MPPPAPDDAIPGHYAAAGPETPPRPPLEGAVDVDACVVGGGLTGLSAARELARRGAAVALVEARRVGWGASGRNGGQAVAGFAPPMKRVETLVGRADARALWDLARGALRRLEEDAAGCGLRRGFVHAARRRRSLRAFAEWAEAAARDYGYPELAPLDRAGLAAHVASPLYAGGLYDAGARHLDPLALCRALAAGAESAGAALYEGSPALEAGGGAVRTRAGRVRAGAVVLACNAHIGALRPELGRHVAPVESFVCATAPLGADLARRLLPSGAAVCDDRRHVDYFRRLPDHRLLFGGGARFAGRRPRGAGFLRRRIAAVFPELAGVEIAHAWSGAVAATRTGLPCAGRTRDGAWFAHGYSGEGLAMSMAAGRAIAAAVCGDGGDFALLSRIPRRALPRPRAPWMWAAEAWTRISG